MDDERAFSWVAFDGVFILMPYKRKYIGDNFIISNKTTCVYASLSCPVQCCILAQSGNVVLCVFEGEASFAYFRSGLIGESLLAPLLTFCLTLWRATCLREIDSTHLRACKLLCDFSSLGVIFQVILAVKDLSGWQKRSRPRISLDLELLSPRLRTKTIEYIKLKHLRTANRSSTRLTYRTGR